MPAIAEASAAAGEPPGASPTPSPRATASGTSVPSVIAASSIHHTPSAKPARRASASARATVVLPMPPAPTMETSRCSPIRDRSVASSTSRPIGASTTSGTFPRPTDAAGFGTAGPAGAGEAVAPWTATSSVKRYPRPGMVAMALGPSTLRRALTCTCRLFSSTIVEGQTRSSSSFLLTTRSRRSARACSRSNARLPSSTALPSTSRRRWSVRTSMVGICRSLRYWKCRSGCLPSRPTVRQTGRSDGCIKRRGCHRSLAPILRSNVLQPALEAPVSKTLPWNTNPVKRRASAWQATGRARSSRPRSPGTP